MANFDIQSLINELNAYTEPKGNISSIIPYDPTPETWQEYYRNMGFAVTEDIHDIDKKNADYVEFTNLVADNPDDYKDYINAVYAASLKSTDPTKAKNKWATFSEVDRKGKVTITDKEKFKNWYIDKRQDGFFGPIHHTARKITEGQPGAGNGNNAARPGNNDIHPAGTSADGENPLFMMDNIILEGGNNENTEEDPFLINPVLKKEFKKTHHWLLPQLAGYYNEARTARNVAREKKKGLSIPEVTPKKKYAKTTDAYFSRTELEKEARRLEQQAATPLYSDPVAQDKYKESLLK